MSAKVLVKTADLSRADWLRYRTMGIGGSDVSVIAGINPYRSVYQLWLEKTGLCSCKVRNIRSCLPTWME